MKILQLILKDSCIFFALYMCGYASYVMIGSIIDIWSLYKNRLRERMHNELYHDFYFPVSILVPAFNEETTILSTINNLLELDYKIFVIVVVDDVSTDNTSKLVIATYHLEKNDMPVLRQVPCKEITEVYSGDIGGSQLFW